MVRRGNPFHVTYKKLGRKWGVTRERVRQIEAQAMRRLRQMETRMMLKDFKLKGDVNSVDLYAKDDLKTLIRTPDGKGVSIYLPTHQMDRAVQHDPIRFYIVLNSARQGWLSAK